MILFLWMKKWRIQAPTSSTSDPAVSTRGNWYLYLAVLLIAGIVYLSCIVSPPSLMDDVDAVQAQIARNMLTSGDWVTARLDGVAYLEKAAADLLDDGGLLQDLRRARLGCAHSDCAVCDRPVLADRGVRRVGVR